MLKWTAKIPQWRTRTPRRALRLQSSKPHAATTSSATSAPKTQNAPKPRPPQIFQPTQMRRRMRRTLQTPQRTLPNPRKLIKRKLSLKKLIPKKSILKKSTPKKLSPKRLSPSRPETQDPATRERAADTLRLSGRNKTTRKSRKAKKNKRFKVSLKSKRNKRNKKSRKHKKRIKTTKTANPHPTPRPKKLPGGNRKTQAPPGDF